MGRYPSNGIKSLLMGILTLYSPRLVHEVDKVRSVLIKRPHGMRRVVGSGYAGQQTKDANTVLEVLIYLPASGARVARRSHRALDCSSARVVPTVKHSCQVG